MKELSIEEKAKRYDEALEKAKNWQNHLYEIGDKDYADELNYLFSELAESEDDRIRKALIKLVKKAGEGYENVIDGVSIENAIAWLEKQDAKVSAIEGFETEFERQVSGFIASAINKEYEYNQGYVKWTANALLNYAKHELEKQGKQKPTDEEMKALLRTEYEKGRADAIEEMQNPAWSEEDETVLNNLIWTLKEDMVLTSDRDTYTSWLKSLKNRVQPQPKQEWSEEDEENFARVDYACLKVYGGDSYSSDWLRKFLGIHKKWKPSEGQLECLGYAIENAEKDWSPLTNNRIYLTLKALKEQLKKLREE